MNTLESFNASIEHWEQTQGVRFNEKQSLIYSSGFILPSSTSNDLNVRKVFI